MIAEITLTKIGHGIHPYDFLNENLQVFIFNINYKNGSKINLEIDSNV